MIPRGRALRIGLWFALAVLLAAAGATWWRAGGLIRSRAPRKSTTPLTAWKGGDLLACGVTVDGASLQEFAREYNVVMLCGLGRSDDRVTDRTITVSDAFGIEPHDFVIEEAVSAAMRVRLADMAHARHAESQQAERLVEEDLWYELALLPKGADAFDIRSLSDVERLGGRLLLAEPRWSAISTWQP